jgi:predicted DNA-binding protein
VIIGWARFIQKKKLVMKGAVRLDHDDIQRLKNLAKQKGLTQDALARIWIKEKLRQEKTI